MVNLQHWCSASKCLDVNGDGKAYSYGLDKWLNSILANEIANNNVSWMEADGEKFFKEVKEEHALSFVEVDRG